jgi:hypothetical protein
LAAAFSYCFPGCAGILTWRTVFSSASPDHKATVRVEVTNCFFGDCNLQIVASRGWRSRRIAQGLDCAVFFAHAAWSGSVVGIFVDGTYCGQIRAAYDFSSDRIVDYKIIEPTLRDSIIREYRVTAEELKANSGDVFKRATYPGHCCSRSVDDFRKRFP